MLGLSMMTRKFPHLIVAAAWVAALCSVAAAQQNSEALQVVADQVRTQGYACANPQGVQRDPDLSRPDLPVWILTCENNRYRVELVPDMQARVTQLD
jgi:hypothetical protein